MVRRRTCPTVGVGIFHLSLVRFLFSLNNNDFACQFIAIKMDIVGKIMAMLEVEDAYIAERDLFAYVQDKTYCNMHEFSSVLTQLFTNGLLTRRVESNGIVSYKKTSSFLLPEFLCEMCKVNCNSYSQYAAHIQGHQHVTNLHAVRTGSRDRTQWFTCGLCRKRVNSPIQLMIHMAQCCALFSVGSTRDLPKYVGVTQCDHDFPDSQGSCSCKR